MSNEKQIAANRANARRSSGPKTGAGKARSRTNAWKHGLTAEKVVIRGEDAQELDAIRREVWEEYQPLPGMESLLVERLAHFAWRIRRALIFEAALLEDGASGAGRLGYNGGNALATLLRYEMSLTNASHRTLQQLLFLQDRRRDGSEGTIIEGERAQDQPVARLVNPPVAAE